jgi:hypothetical protein
MDINVFAFAFVASIYALVVLITRNPLTSPGGQILATNKSYPQIYAAYADPFCPQRRTNPHRSY